MSADYIGLSGKLLELVESESPDWSTVSLDEVHDAANNLKVHLLSRYDRKSEAELEQRRKMGSYMKILMRVKAQKWAERGGDALVDAIFRTRASLRQTDRLGLYSEMYLEYLVEEGEKAAILAPGENDHLKSIHRH